MASANEIRHAIVEAYRELTRLGLNVASAGNVSVRHGAGMLITPTGCSAEALKASDIVALRLDGTSTAKLKPSSEWAMHAQVYARVRAAGAVVHAHADHCVAMASLRKAIPAFHYMVHAFGGSDVPCVGYHPFGSAELAAAAGAALTERSACLLANHGLLTRGPTLKAAFDGAILLETLARQYGLALAAGKPVLLGQPEMAEVAQRFADYGSQPRARARQKPRWQVP